MHAIKLSHFFTGAAVSDEDEDDITSTGGSGSPKYWKLKKTRNGFKGRTFKHPENMKKKAKRPEWKPIPLTC